MRHTAVLVSLVICFIITAVDGNDRSLVCLCFCQRLIDDSLTVLSRQWSPAEVFWRNVRHPANVTGLGNFSVWTTK